jgi:FkbM family methyltransferase
MLKPLLFKLLGPRGYFHMQVHAKAKDIRRRLVEEKEMALLPRFVDEGDHVLDIGANFAYYTTRLSTLVGGAGKVTAFEPIPFTSGVCAALLKKFDAINVALFQKGVGARDEHVKFSVPLQDSGAMSAGQAHILGRNNELEGKEDYYSFTRATEFTCHVVALDEFLSLDERPLSFVKIDIEGAEFYALQGMRRLLEEHRPVVLIEIQPFFLEGFGIEESALVNFIDQLGYDLYLYDQGSGKLRPHPAALIDSNYLMIHRDRTAEFEDILA